MKPTKAQLDALLESWARWEHQGGQLGPGGGNSLLGKLIDNKGELQFGTGRPSGPQITCREEAVALLVARMYQHKPDWAVALRVEYGVQRVPGLSRYARQPDRAKALGIALRTYRSRVKKARDHLAGAL